MPKEKSLFFIGVWLIILAYFIGLPTDIKNILFLITGLLIISISYASYFSNFKSSDYFNKKDKTEKDQLKKEEVVKRESFRKSEKKITVPEPMSVEEEVMEKKEKIFEEEKPFFNEYEPPIKIRKSRVRKPKVIREESIIMQEEDDTDDVIVISSDGDN